MNKALLALKPNTQDRVWLLNRERRSDPWHEEGSYVVGCEAREGIIELMSWNGHSWFASIEDICDIQPTKDPIEVIIPPETWRRHGGESSYFNKPIRVLALGYFEGRPNTVVVPKNPGRIRGGFLHLDLLDALFVVDRDISALARSLPGMGFNTHRGADPENDRRRQYRTAGGRIQRWLEGYRQGRAVRLPANPPAGESSIS